MSARDLPVQRRLLVAGSVGPERVPARPDGDEPRWFEPLHVRDEAAARARVADQVAAGADAVVAPTWLTHRRALLPLGETRRARDWTQTAVRIARDGVEVGRERREEARLIASQSDDGTDSTTPLLQTAPLVGVVLPGLDEGPEPGDGRLLPREAATDRDYRDQAGLLADAEPDFILVEGQRTATDARAAVDAAAESGLAMWVAAPRALAGGADDGAPLAYWIESCRHAGAELLLLPGPVETPARLAVDSGMRWGGLVADGGVGFDGTAVAGQSSAWLEAGAAAIALLDGATQEALVEVRATLDEREHADVEAHRTVLDRWNAHVARAARMSAGGAALWLGPEPESSPPDGFEWLVVDAAESGQLPRGHYRLIVVAGSRSDDSGSLGSWLEDRGILVRAVAETQHLEHDLRLLSLDTDAQPALAIYRREQ